VKHRPPLVDIVCHGCQTVLAREERENGERRGRAERRPANAEPRLWTVKVLDEAGNITDQWPDKAWRCWNCDTMGYVNAFDVAFAKEHGRVRIPIRPFV
jgi:leucyl-tRNA synthetase